VLAVWRQAAAGYDDMGMRMVGQCRSPAVQHGGEPDAGAEMLGVGHDGDQGLGGAFVPSSLLLGVTTKGTST
jgi:hypothetical protein